ncbi:MAG: YfcC family protein [Eggerthellaceae bacterium]|nr:YfcC family protein [Eggerthellaceae bacterium]
MSAERTKKQRRTLSSFAILLIILVALALVTVAMSFAGVKGIEGASIAGVMTAPVRGFTDALPVCLFVLVLGGFLGIVAETGALDAGIAALVKKLKGNELVLIPILMFVFSIGGTTYGMCEETVPFYLLLAATMVAAGFDSVVGAAVVLLGAGCGVLGSTVNPFAIGAAVDALSGTDLVVNQAVIIALGVVLWLVTLAISIVFVMRYAKKVKADKGSTILSLQEQKVMEEAYAGVEADVAADLAHPDDPTMTGRQKATLVVFALTFVVMIVGFIPWEDLGVGLFNEGATYEEVVAPVSEGEIVEVFDEATGSSLALDPGAGGVATFVEQISEGWSAFLTGLPLGQWYFDEASTWFLLMALVIGVIGGLSESRFVKSFIGGAADMMSVVLVIALARSITVLMADTGLDMWILEHAAHALAGMSAIVFAPLSYALYLLLSFLIPSSSGMATVSMPIMGPLAAELGFSVETMIMIFSAGNGLINMITPTSGAIMGGLALAKIDYTTWVKFSTKLIVLLGVVCVIILTGAMLIL